MLAGGQAQQALHVAKEGLALFATNDGLYNIAGVCAVTVGEYAQAEHYWLQAIEFNPKATQAYYNLGLLHANNKRAIQAEQYYRQAIVLDPGNATIHSNLGALLSDGKRHYEAEQCYRRAIALNPGYAMAYSNLGVLLASLQNLDEAEQCYRKAIELDAANIKALSNLGNLLARNERHDEAEQCYRKTIALDRNNAPAYFHLGLLLSSLKRDEEAEQCYRKAIAIDPGYAIAYSNLGVLLAKEQRDNEAEHCCRKAIALDPGNAIAHSNLGKLLAKRKHYDKAEQHYRKAITIDPTCATAYTNLGLLLEDLKRYDEAEKNYLQAIACAPNAAISYSNLGLFLTRTRREEEAEQCFRQAITVDPTFSIAHFNLGFLLLRQGRLSEGWPYFETRNDPNLPDENKHPCPINAPFPQWQGESLAGKSLLVWPEQGLGDEIQFCRYLSLLKEQGAAQITLLCKAPLTTLMETLEGVDTVISLGEADTVVTAHDYWIYPLSIPLHCQTTLTTIPARLPYLQALPDRVTRWSARLPHQGFRVGLVWKGNRLHTNDNKRSLPGLVTLAPLWSVPGVRFVSLQKGQGEDEARNPPAEQPLIDLGAEIDDFGDTAAIVEQLDLVICVDTAVAHLAGALAKPCWVLLPAEKGDWRWLKDRNDSPWYPGVMRLFRQTRDEDWTSVVLDIKSALRDEIAKGRPA